MHLPWNKFMRLYNDSNNLFTCKRILIGSIHVLRGAYVLPIATSRAFSELAGKAGEVAIDVLHFKCKGS